MTHSHFPPHSFHSTYEQNNDCFFVFSFFPSFIAMAWWKLFKLLWCFQHAIWGTLTLTEKTLSFTYCYLLDFAFGARDGQHFGHASISCLACLELYWEWDKHLLLQKTNGKKNKTKHNKTNATVHFDLTIKSRKKLHQFWHQEMQYRCHCCQPCSIFLLKSGAHFSCLQCPSSAVMGSQPACKPICSLQQSVIITFLLPNCRVSFSTEHTQRQKNTFNHDSKALIMSGAKANSTKHTRGRKVWGAFRSA